MWTANVDKTGIENDKFIVYLTLINNADGNKKQAILPLRTNLSIHEVNQAIQSQLDLLNNIETITQYPIGPFIQDVVIPPQTPPLTDEQKRLAAYQKSMGIRSTILFSVSNGAMATDDPLVASSLDLVHLAIVLVQPIFQQQIADALIAVQGASAIPKP